MDPDCASPPTQCLHSTKWTEKVDLSQAPPSLTSSSSSALLPFQMNRSSGFPACSALLHSKRNGEEALSSPHKRGLHLIILPHSLTDWPTPLLACLPHLCTLASPPLHSSSIGCALIFLCTSSSCMLILFQLLICLLILPPCLLAHPPALLASLACPSAGSLIFPCLLDLCPLKHPHLPPFSRFLVHPSSHCLLRAALLAFYFPSLALPPT